MRKLIPSEILGNTELCQLQASPKVNDRVGIELSDAVRNGLLDASESEDSRSRGKEEEDGAPAVNEETTSAYSVGRTGPEFIEPSGLCP